MLRGDEPEVITARDERGDVGLRKKAAGLAAAVALIAPGDGALVGDRGVLHLMTQREREQTLAREIEALRDENARLSGDSAALRTDPAAIERIAREELGLARPGETVFLIRDAPSASPR